MATGREARAERLIERLRGAQNHNVGDISFDLGIAIPGLGAPLPSSSPRETPNTSRKRKRDGEAPSSAEQRSSERRRSSRLSQDIYDLPDTSKESVEQVNGSVRVEEVTVEEEEPARPRTRASGAMLPPMQLPSSARSKEVEEVEESPAHAPGSGRRHPVNESSALASSARLQDALGSEQEVPMSSSPSEKKRRRSSAALGARSSLRRTLGDGSDEIVNSDADEDADDDEDQVEPVKAPEETVMSPEVDVEAEDEQGESAAEEISAKQAVEALRNRKRTRPSAREPSLELGEDRQEEEEENAEEQPSKRRRGRPPKSPAVQKQGVPKTKEKQATNRKKASPRTSLDHQEPTPEARPSVRGVTREKPSPKQRSVTSKSADRPVAKKKSAAHEAPSPVTAKSKPSRKPKQKTARKSRRISEEGDTKVIDVTVQRFINYKRRAAGGNDDISNDELLLDIPNANNAKETVVDVFAQVCEEVIALTQGQFQQLLDREEDAAMKKEYRVKMRAIEAYRHELSSRLLQHAIYLNHWHSLRKRVRQVQKEKLALREDIMRLRNEREEVALRMDAIRLKHETEQKETDFLLNTSTTMRDIDRVVEAGQDAPELPPKKKKELELANLDLVVNQVAEQASSASSGGGLLKQLQEFNAFLERTATAIESR